MINKKTEICGIFNYAIALKKTDLTEQTVDTLSDAQGNLINDNLYVKSEIDMKFEQMLAKFDQSRAEDNARFEKSRAESDIRFQQALAKFDQSRIEDNARHEKVMLQIENRFEKSIHDVMYKIIGILGSIVILTGALASLWHHFI